MCICGGIPHPSWAHGATVSASASGSKKEIRMEEIWKRIAGADRFYEISNRGRARIAIRANNDGSIISEHLIPPINNGFGYIQYAIKYGGKKKKDTHTGLLLRRSYPISKCFLTLIISTKTNQTTLWRIYNGFHIGITCGKCLQIRT